MCVKYSHDGDEQFVSLVEAQVAILYRLKVEQRLHGLLT